MREFGSEYAYQEVTDGYFTNICSKFTEKVKFTRSGRDALSLVAETILGEGVVLFPNFCCSSMVMPFSNRNFQIAYYSINEFFEWDENELSLLIKDFQPKAILVMNYFGMKSTKELVNLIKNVDDSVIIIEDFTHVLLNFHEVHNVDVDFYCASIRKWIGVPDGGIVISNNGTSFRNLSFDESDDFVKNREIAQKIKFRYRFTKNETDKLEYRMLLKSSEERLDDFDRAMAVSFKGLNKIKHTNWSDISFARKTNYDHLKDLLKEMPFLTFLGSVGENTPFSLPILVSQRDLIQKKLSKKGVFAAVLWPLPYKTDKLSYSYILSKNILSLPIDQRYGFDDIEEIASILKGL